ncbi:MAG: hypothetical protein DWH79_09145 [Planctomycetota bacterium]|nr:MAG: hypothetical protein DWH79_09145 [Planctomycetota bacterium]
MPRTNRPVAARRGRQAEAGHVHPGAGEAELGLVAVWAKDTTIGNRLANARAETVAEKPSFRHANGDLRIDTSRAPGDDRGDDPTTS